MNETPFHERFPPIETSLVDRIFRNAFMTTSFLSNFLPGFFGLVFSGPKHQDWNFKYSMVVLAIRSFMIRKPSRQLEDFHKSQEYFASLKVKIEEGITVKEVEYSVNSDVVDFFKQKAPGEWPAVAADLDHKVNAEWVSHQSSDHKKVIYHCHGGAYLWCSTKTHFGIIQKLAKEAKAKVFAVNYRLAPLHPYPCGLIDAVSGYLELLKEHDPEDIILVGDSAGGGLSLALAMVLRDWKKPMPGGLYLQSPWLDLATSFPSARQWNHIDYIPTGEFLPDPRRGQRKNMYTTDDNLMHPYVSPYNGNFENLPPILIQSGSIERLDDEIVATSFKASAGTGSNVTFERYAGHVHVFPGFFRVSEGADTAIQRAAGWMRAIHERNTVDPGRISLDFKGKVVNFSKW